ncbi:MAG: TRAP transporter large permease subunit [Bradyrhizobiaceae bacterium]|nr:TRAP transporter large permease subunit [Bradyrhizobiaceae bacterium]
MELETLMVTLMFITFIALMFSGYPVAFVLAGTGTLFAFLGEILKAYDISIGVDVNYLGLVVNRIWGVMSNSSLVSVTLFILMGYLLERGGIAEQLIAALRQLFRRVPGGLALSVIIVGVVLAASTGVIGASLILLGTLAIRPMLNAGYKPDLALGSIAAAGCLGILIPPSIMLVVMGDQMLIPVGDLFMGAVVPGLILAFLYGIYVVVISLVIPSYAPAEPQTDRKSEPVVLVLLNLAKALLPPVLLIFAVLGSIFFGIATPSEAAGVGAFGALLLAVVNRQLSWKSIASVSLDTVRTTSFVFGIFIGATCFAVVLRGIGGDQVIGEALFALEFGATGTVIFILFIIFILGFFLDWIEITLIMMPLIRPVLMHFEVDLLWFTILAAVCLQTSFLTPPMGPALFYVKTLAPPDVRLMEVYRGIVPFVLLQLAGLAIAFLFPETVSWLPSIVYSGR